MGLVRARSWEVGCDEAGRGALAGPVVAAAVCLPETYDLPGLQDSKQLSPELRASLGASIRVQGAWAVGSASAEEVDEINVLQASILAMHRALAGLSCGFRIVLVDGPYFRPYSVLPYRCIVRGDRRYDAIAAASIVAKTYRDALMQERALQYRIYGWTHNKGYPTAVHRAAICRYGLSPLHRKSFRCKGSG